MLKSVKKKSKSKGITSRFKDVGRDNNFKNSSILLTTEDIYTQTLSKLNKVASIPKMGEHHHIVTQNAINSFDFIIGILAKEKIKNLYIAFYRIGKKVVTELNDLIEKNHIQKIHLLINDGFPKLVPDCWNLIKQLESDNFTVRVENNHTKIILIETDENFYVIEGSGNLSINARIEQYIFMNNKEVYDFHKRWIEKI